MQVWRIPADASRILLLSVSLGGATEAGGAEVVVVGGAEVVEGGGASVVGAAVVVGSGGGAASSSLLQPANMRAAAMKEKESFASVLADFIHNSIQKILRSCRASMCLRL